MPFTFSHPAIVLPLTRLSTRWYSMTGLIAGSVAPDWEYFFRMNTISTHSHTLWGVLYFNLPLGLLLAFTYHGLVREAFIENLPGFISKHVVAYKAFNWGNHFRQNWMAVIFSVLIGACSHLLWDSFTHVHGYFVGLFPSLKQIVIRTPYFGIPIFTILQHGSTLVGGAYIYYFIKKLPEQEGFSTKINFRYWLSVFLITAVVTALRVILSTGAIFSGDIIVTIVAGSLTGILITSMITPLIQWRIKKTHT